MTAPLGALLVVFPRLRLARTQHRRKQARSRASLFAGVYGDPVQMRLGKSIRLAKETRTWRTNKADAKAFADILAQTRVQLICGRALSALAGMFPGVWSDWQGRRAHRRLRRHHRQSALGSHEAATGRMVRRPPTARSPWHSEPPTASDDRRPRKGKRSACPRLRQGRDTRRSRHCGWRAANWRAIIRFFQAAT